MMYSEGDQGYRNERGVEVKVSAPRGDWTHYHVTVIAGNCKVIECGLTEENIESLSGSGETSISTCASIWGMIEDACRDFHDAPLPRGEN